MAEEKTKISKSKNKTEAEKLGEAFGYLYQGEIKLLQKLAKSLPGDAVCVNFGAGSGTSSLTMIEANKSLAKNFTTIDISAGGPLGGLQNEVNAFEGAGMSEYIPHQILGDSADVASAFNDEEVDFVFVDGGHSYEQCAADIDAWLPKLKVGGLMAVHDYERDVWPDVKLATDERMKNKHEFVDYVDTLIVYRK